MIKMVYLPGKLFSAVDKLFEKLSDEQLQKQVAPGKKYGNLLSWSPHGRNRWNVATFRICDKALPGLEKIFLESPDAVDIKCPH
jgi:hypothetical protein